jgi:hypothetical protein
VLCWPSPRHCYLTSTQKRVQLGSPQPSASFSFNRPAIRRRCICQLAVIPLKSGIWSEAVGLTEALKSTILLDCENTDRSFHRVQAIENLPSALTVMSRFVAPAGFSPTTVPGSAESAPLEEIANPEMVGSRHLKHRQSGRQAIRLLLNRCCNPEELADPFGTLRYRDEITVRAERRPHLTYWYSERHVSS